MTGGQVIGVEHERLVALIGSMKRASSDIQEQLNNLVQESKTLRTQWNGDAQQAFGLAHRSWDEKLRNMNQTLVQLAAAASVAQQTLQHADRHAKDLWS